LVETITNLAKGIFKGDIIGFYSDDLEVPLNSQSTLCVISVDITNTEINKLRESFIRKTTEAAYLSFRLIDGKITVFENTCKGTYP
jgi:hypothetical protein